MTVRFSELTGRTLTLYPVKPDSVLTVRQELKLWASEGMSGYAGIGELNVAARTLMKGTPQAHRPLLLTVKVTLAQDHTH